MQESTAKRVKYDDSLFDDDAEEAVDSKPPPRNPVLAQLAKQAFLDITNTMKPSNFELTFDDEPSTSNKTPDVKPAAKGATKKTPKAPKLRPAIANAVDVKPDEPVAKKTSSIKPETMPKPRPKAVASLVRFAQL